MATDTRLWLYGALQDTRAYLADLIKTAIDRAELDVDVIMPGFTHLQACSGHPYRIVASLLLSHALTHSKLMNPKEWRLAVSLVGFLF